MEFSSRALSVLVYIYLCVQLFCRSENENSKRCVFLLSWRHLLETILLATVDNVVSEFHARFFCNNISFYTSTIFRISTAVQNKNAQRKQTGLHIQALLTLEIRSRWKNMKTFTTSLTYYCCHFYLQWMKIFFIVMRFSWRTINS